MSIRTGIFAEERTVWEMSETRVDANNAEPFTDYGGVGRVAQLVPGKTDADRAAEIKQRAQAAWAPILALMDEAAATGFLLRWQGITPNAFGKHELVDLHLLKKF